MVQVWGNSSKPMHLQPLGTRVKEEKSDLKGEKTLKSYLYFSFFLTEAKSGNCTDCHVSFSSLLHAGIDWKTLRFQILLNVFRLVQFSTPYCSFIIVFTSS